MAGIGFELKKLFSKKGLLNNIKAYLYSTMVTIGPFILCTTMITFLQILLKFLDIDFKNRELFLATTVYAFIFSQIISSGFAMIITRYIADKLYKSEFEDILSSLYGVIIINLVIGGILGLLFLYNKKLDFYIKITSYLLYIQLIIMWLLTVYLTALKDFIKIFKGYISGVITSILLAYVLLKFSNINSTLSLLISLDLGIFMIITLLFSYIKTFFKISSKKYFMFLNYIDKYPELFFTNFFYILSVYIHNFIFWQSKIRVIVENTYVYAPIYDVPTFYAFISIMPSMIIFVVSIETVFYKKYRAYYSLVTGNGNFNDIENARKNMTKVLWSELRNIMQLQLGFSILAIVLGNIFLPRIGIIQLSLDIFNILVLATYSNSIYLIILLIMLYFEDRKGAILSSIIFLITNITFTNITLNYGETYYGLGFFISAFITLIFAVSRLIYFIRNIHYFTFCSQPIVYREKRGIFTYINDKIYKL